MVMLDEIKNTKGYEYVFGKLAGFLDKPSDESKNTNNNNNNDNKVPNPVSLLDQQINIGDYVCVSTEEGEFGMGTGIIKKLSLDTLVVSCSDKISQPLAVKRGDMIRMYNETAELYVPSTYLLSDINCLNRPTALWRIDKNEVGSGFTTARVHLLLMHNKASLLIMIRPISYDCFHQMMHSPRSIVA